MFWPTNWEFPDVQLLSRFQDCKKKTLSVVSVLTKAAIGRLYENRTRYTPLTSQSSTKKL